MSKFIVQHHHRTDRWYEHLTDFNEFCPECKPRVERAARLPRFLQSFKEFGYDTLTLADIANPLNVR